MTVQFSDDHIGRLIVDSGMQVQTEIDGVTFAAARSAFEDLAAHRSPIIVDVNGSMHIIDGLRFIAAEWKPERG